MTLRNPWRPIPHGASMPSTLALLLPPLESSTQFSSSPSSSVNSMDELQEKYDRLVDLLGLIRSELDDIIGSIDEEVDVDQDHQEV